MALNAALSSNNADQINKLRYQPLILQKNPKMCRKGIGKNTLINLILQDLIILPNATK